MREEFNKNDIQKILVVRNDNIGDVICSTPALQALRENFKGAYIAVLVASYSREAILENPHVDEVFVYDKFKHGKYDSRFIAWWNQYKVLKVLREKRFDLAIGLRPTFSPSQGWLVYFTGAEFRLGCYPTKRKHKKFRFFYNLLVEEDRGAIHAVEKNLKMLERIGVKPKDKVLTVSIPESELTRIDDFLARNGLQNKLLIGFYITSRLKENNLEDEKFAAIAEGLIERYRAEVLLTHAPWEKERAMSIAYRVKGHIHAFDTETLKSLGALQKRCSLFISVDGGPMHLAAATGVPTIGLFGKTDPIQWRPWGERNAAIKKGNHVNSITIEDILKETDRVLKEPLSY